MKNKTIKQSCLDEGIEGMIPSIVLADNSKQLPSQLSKTCFNEGD